MAGSEEGAAAMADDSRDDAGGRIGRARGTDVMSTGAGTIGNRWGDGASVAARSGAAGSSSGALFTKDIGKDAGKETGKEARGEGAAWARRVTKRGDRRRDEAGPFSPAGTDRIEPAGATVDEAIRTLMRDPRYWRDRDKGLSDHVVRQWRRAYPGRGRRERGGPTALSPAIRPDEVEPWPPAESHAWPNPSGDDTIHPRPAVIMPGFEWDARNGEWVSVPPGSEGHEGRADAQPHPFRHATGVGGTLLGGAGDDTVMSSTPKDARAQVAQASPSSGTPPGSGANKISVPPSLVGIDMKFIHAQEGYETNGYVPYDNNGNVDGSSGVTIGAGVDLGQMNDYDINRLVKNHGLDPALAARLKPYLGLTRKAADSFLAANPITLTKAEAEQLSNAKYDQIAGDLANRYDKAMKAAGRPDTFATLPPKE